MTSTESTVSLSGLNLCRLPDPIGLPKISFILRNWNYARFVGAAIRSIKDQDYTNFDAVVIDNNSDDASRDVIKECTSGDDRFRTLFLDGNRGPLGGVIPGLSECDGDFVCFVDSDDVLMPNFASMHIQAHLALHQNVAFTSNNVLEIGGNGAVLSSGRAALSGAGKAERRGLRDAAVVPRLSTVTNECFSSLASATTRFVPTDTGWLWGPGTANVYRRFVIDLIVPDRPEEVLARMATDAHFARLAHVLGGSALINMPLSGYRIHGDNHFASSPSLSGLKSGGGPASRNFSLRRNEALRTLLSEPRKFSWLMGPARYWSAIDGIARADGVQLRDAFADPDLRALVKQNLPAVVEVFGHKRTAAELARRFRWSHLREMLWDQPTTARYAFRKKIGRSLGVGKMLGAFGK